MSIKNNWWKILAAVMMIYVIIAGFLIPLKPGILTVSPTYIKNGENTSIKVQAYNANYDKEPNLRAWLKFDSTHYLASSQIEVLDHNNLNISFNLNTQIPTTDTIAPVSLIIDSSVDGYSLLPGAISIKNTFDPSLPAFTNSALSDMHAWTGIKFPFRNILYETIRNTFFHVAIWMALFLLSTIAAIYSILFLRDPTKLAYEHRAYSFTAVSLLYGMIGLATGAVWARFTWGAYWTNDVRLNMAAVSVMIYFAYFILRGTITDQDKSKRFAAAFNIFAYVAMIPLLLVIPRLTDSLHPGVGGNPAFSGEDLDNTLRMVFYPAIISMILLGVWMAQIRTRIFKIEERRLLEQEL